MACCGVGQYCCFASAATGLGCKCARQAGFLRRGWTQVPRRLFSTMITELDSNIQVSIPGMWHTPLGCLVSIGVPGIVERVFVIKLELYHFFPLPLPLPPSLTHSPFRPLAGELVVRSGSALTGQVIRPGSVLTMWPSESELLPYSRVMTPGLRTSEGWLSSLNP
jgi:hypothetical protein